MNPSPQNNPPSDPQPASFASGPSLAAHATTIAFDSHEWSALLVEAGRLGLTVEQYLRVVTADRIAGNVVRPATAQRPKEPRERPPRRAQRGLVPLRHHASNLRRSP